MHGRERRPRGEPSREEATKVAQYTKAKDTLLAFRAAPVLSPDHALPLTEKLLTANPDLYTAHNVRRDALLLAVSKDPSSAPALFANELTVMARALLKNPKSYSVWAHRLWVIEQGFTPLSEELALVTKFLEADERNFHCWQHRRRVAALAIAQGVTTIAEEIAYTGEKISGNFSNYSAWHYRSALLPLSIEGDMRSAVAAALAEAGADDASSADAGAGADTGASATAAPLSEAAIARAEAAARAAFSSALSAEVEFVSTAFAMEPDDQSAWLYHRWLLGVGASAGKGWVEHAHAQRAPQQWLAATGAVSADAGAQSKGEGKGKGKGKGQSEWRLSSLTPFLPASTLQPPPAAIAAPSKCPSKGVTVGTASLPVTDDEVASARAFYSHPVEAQEQAQTDAASAAAAAGAAVVPALREGLLAAASPAEAGVVARLRAVSPTAPTAADGATGAAAGAGAASAGAGGYGNVWRGPVPRYTSLFYVPPSSSSPSSSSSSSSTSTDSDPAHCSSAAAAVVPLSALSPFLTPSSQRSILLQRLSWTRRALSFLLRDLAPIAAESRCVTQHVATLLLAAEAVAHEARARGLLLPEQGTEATAAVAAATAAAAGACAGEEGAVKEWHDALVAAAAAERSAPDALNGGGSNDEEEEEEGGRLSLEEALAAAVPTVEELEALAIDAGDLPEYAAAAAAAEAAAAAGVDGSAAVVGGDGSAQRRAVVGAVFVRLASIDPLREGYYKDIAARLRR